MDQLCCNCKTKLCEDGKKRCRECLDRQKFSASERRRKRKFFGLCVECGASTDRGYYCNKCLLTMQTSRLKKKQEGICLCGGILDGRGTFCSKCRRRHNHLASVRRSGWKEQGLCVKCGGVRDCDLAKCLKCRTLAKNFYARQTSKLGVECVDCGEPVAGCRNCPNCAVKRCAIKWLGTVSKAEELHQLFKRQKGICPYTGKALTLGKDSELDHIIPRNRGGSDDIENLQWVYAPVNRMKWHHQEKDFLELIKLVYEYKLRMA